MVLVGLFVHVEGFEVSCEVVDAVYVEELADDVGGLQVTGGPHVVLYGTAIVALGVQVITVLLVNILQTVRVVLVGPRNLK